VTTGHDAAGRSIVASDRSIEPRELALAPGMGIAQLWRTDQPTVPSTGAPTEGLAYFPAPGGVSYIVVTLPPDAPPPPGIDLPAALAEAEAAFPGMLQVMEPDQPGMHTTDTVDFGVILSGRVILELDDGATVTLGAGGCFVQNGTRHAWRVPFAEPCTMAVVPLGARRD